MAGTPAPVLQGVATTAQGAADVAVATNGSLVYVPGGAGGGHLPLWSRDGELFFGTPDNRQMLAVPVQSGTTLVAGRPQVLFEFAMLAPAGETRPYDIAPDGRFLVIRSGQAEAGGGTASNMILVLNWFEELKRLVPTN